MGEGPARAVLAGFLVGYAAGIAFTAMAAIMLVRLRQRVRFLERAISPALSPVAVAVPVSLVAFLVWTAIGMVFGLIFDGLEDAAPRGGLGSPNLAFTLLVLGTGLLPAAPFFVLLGSFRRHLAVALVAYAGLFGWGLPHLIV